MAPSVGKGNKEGVEPGSAAGPVLIFGTEQKVCVWEIVHDLGSEPWNAAVDVMIQSGDGRI